MPISSRSAELRRARAKKDSPRREELLRIALELFATKGYHNTSVRDIADHAQIVSGSLFYHFKSKESILEELIAPYFNKLLTNASEVARDERPASETIAGLIEVTIATVSEGTGVARIARRDWSVIVSNFPEVVASVNTVDSIWLTVLEQGAKDGEFRSDLDPKITYNMIRGALSDTVTWYSEGGRKTALEIASIYSLVFLEGIRKR